MREAVLALVFLAPAWADTVSPLLARGYTVMRQPQVVGWGAADFAFSSGWRLDRGNVAKGDAAVEVLTEELRRRDGIELSSSGRPDGTLRLVIAPNSARVGAAQDRDREVLAQQAYKI